MDDGMRRPFYRLERFLNDMLPRLGQHLNRYVVRNHVPFNKRPDKLVFRIGGSRKSHFDFFKPDLYQHLEIFQLLTQSHRFHEGLVSVAQIHAAPDRRFINIILRHPVVGHDRRHKIRFSIFYFCIHFRFLPVLLMKSRPRDSPRSGFYLTGGRSC